MWFQLGAIALGIWLMVAPAVLPATASGAAVDRIAGPVVCWVGVLALRSETRGFRALNLLSGLFLLIAPWLVPNTDTLAMSSYIVGWLVIALAIIAGPRQHRAGAGRWANMRPEAFTSPRMTESKR